jgi:membrane protease YdiL (CAAX protease family)
MRLGRVVFKVVAVYLVVSAALLMMGFLFPIENEFANSAPIMLSLSLLVPIYVWYRWHSGRVSLSREIDGRDERLTVYWIFALFLLAMGVRMMSVLWFDKPYEKTSVVYLVVSTIALVEGTDVSVFGFKTRKFAKALLLGLAFFAVFTLSQTLVIGFSVYALGGHLNIQRFDLLPFFLVMPFMILCVGVSEEGLFRGYIQSHFERFYSTRKANLCQAALFGVWHFVWDVSPFNPLNMLLYVMSTFMVGLLFGYFYSKARNLVPLMLAHGLGNSFVQGSTPIYEGVESVLEGISPASQLFVMILPYVISILLTFVFTKYLVKKS